MADTGCDALGIDWSTDLAGARQRVGDRVALQGNLDPAVLYASPDVIREKVGDVLAAFGGGSGHVFNLGHGITPDVNPDHLAALIEAVRTLSPGLHS
jgi:uroporphyrinogen decarboxylase